MRKDVKLAQRMIRKYKLDFEILLIDILLLTIKSLLAFKNLILQKRKFILSEEIGDSEFIKEEEKQVANAEDFEDASEVSFDNEVVRVRPEALKQHF